MKRFLTLSTSLLIVLSGCGTASAAAAGQTGNAETIKVVKAATTLKALLTSKPASVGLVKEFADKQQKLYEAQLRHQEKIIINATKIAEMISELKKYVGKTPYIRTGASPSGWDCSGLVMWGYAQIGVELYHGASTQKHSGKIVKEPKLGDIVAFGWKGSYGAQHSGIYLGDGKMLHAGGYEGMRTEIADISDWADGSGNTLVTYTRILEN